MIYQKFLNKTKFLFKKEIEIKIHWPWLLFYANFIIYGFYGAVTNGNYIFQFILSIIIISIQYWLGIFAVNNKYLTTFKFLFKDAFWYSLLVLLVSLIQKDHLILSLTGDDLSYAQSSIVHSLKAAYFVAERSSFLDTIPFIQIIHIISFSVLFFISLFIFLIQKISFKKRILFVITAIIILRGIIFFAGGNSSPHPPLSLLPSFLMGSIFGPTDLSFRLSFHLIFIIFNFVLFQEFKKIFNTPISLCVIISIITIPLLWRLSISLTPSLWTSLIFTFGLVHLINNKKLNYFMLFSIGSIGAMFRIPSLIILFPIGLFLLNDLWRKKLNLNSLGVIILPVILILPFFLNTLFFGTPATDYTTSSLSLFDKIWEAFDSNIVFYSAVNSLDLWWLIFIFLGIFTLQKMKYRLFIFSFFCISLIIYYSIRTELWGSAKYQAEYLIPFIVVGYLSFLIRLNKTLAILIPLILITININSLFDYPNNKLNWQFLIDSSYSKNKRLTSKYGGLIEPILDFKKAHAFINTANFDKTIYTANYNYGILPEIFAGYNVKEILKIQRIREKVEMLTGDVVYSNALIESKIINDIKGLNTIIIGQTSKDKESLKNELLNKGWELVKTIQNYRYDNKTDILIRKTNRAID